MAGTRKIRDAIEIIVREGARKTAHCLFLEKGGEGKAVMDIASQDAAR